MVVEHTRLADHWIVGEGGEGKLTGLEQLSGCQTIIQTGCLQKGPTSSWTKAFGVQEVQAGASVAENKYDYGKA
jgi:hypothetical protein